MITINKIIQFFLIIFIILASLIDFKGAFSADFSLEDYTNKLLDNKGNQQGDFIQNGQVSTNYSQIIVEVKFINEKDKKPILFKAGQLLICLGLDQVNCISAKEVNSEISTLTINQNTSQKSGFFRLKNAQGQNLLKDKEFIFKVDWWDSPDQKKESNWIVTKSTVLVYMNYDSQNEQFMVSEARLQEKENQSNSEITDNLWEGNMYTLKGTIDVWTSLTYPKIIISNSKRTLKENFAIKNGDKYNFSIDLSDLEENDKYYVSYLADWFVNKGEILNLWAKSDLFVFTNKNREIKLIKDYRDTKAPAEFPWFIFSILFIIEFYIFYKIWKWIKIVKNLQDY